LVLEGGPEIVVEEKRWALAACDLGCKPELAENDLVHTAAERIEAPDCNGEDPCCIGDTEVEVESHSWAWGNSFWEHTGKVDT
jgi:hypothetical protein